MGFNAIHSHTHKNENGARKKESCELRLEEEEKGRFIMLSLEVVPFYRRAYKSNTYVPVLMCHES